MPLPTIRDVRPVDPVLTNLSLGYRNAAYFWDQIAPIIEVPEATGTFFEFTRDYWFRRQANGAARAPGNPYARIEYGVATQTYNTQEYGWEHAVDDVLKARSQTPEDLEDIGTQLLTQIMQIELEMQVAAAAFITGVWGTTTTLAGTNQWSDFDGSDPLTDADVAKRTIRRNTGEEPDVLFIGALSWEMLKEHPLLLDKYKHTQTGILTEALVAAALGVGSIVVGKSVQNTAAEQAPGTAAYTGADIWTDNALFLKRTTSPSLMVPNGAYTFIWNERGNVPWAIERYRLDPIRSNIVRIFSHWTINIIAAQYGYIYLDTNA